MGAVPCIVSPVLPYGAKGLPIVEGSEMAAIDRTAIDVRGIPSRQLMENAGAGVAEAILTAFPDLREHRVVCLCGKGNNGGDGFVVTFHIAGSGIDCIGYHIAPRDEYRGDALSNLNLLPHQILKDATRIDTVLEILQGLGPEDVIVDALLGTGAQGAPKGHVAEVIQAVNECPARVVAVDLPSGLNSSTGEIEGDCIQADFTVTMALPKRGHLLPPGSDATGRLIIIPIGLPTDLLEPIPGNPLYATPQWIASLLPGRTANAHKGSAGRLLIIGGSPGFRGAVCLAARSAIRCGAGLVEVAVAESLAESVDIAVLESITCALPHENGALTMRSLEAILERVEQADAVALGPGLGSAEGTRILVQELVARIEKPMVLDADGLNAFAGRRELIERHPNELVLTPHPGEMGRLLDCTTKEVQKDRWGAAAQLARETRTVVVLKGAYTVIASPDGELAINSTGNPGMASAGMGDVLTGAIGALLAQGSSVSSAAVAGAYLHGSAGDLLWNRYGAPVAANDLVEQLPPAIGALGGLRSARERHPAHCRKGV